MNKMELELIFFKRVLRYWISSHNKDFLLLADGLTEDLATYVDGYLVWQECFKHCSNPYAVVSKPCIRMYINVEMVGRMNKFIPCVVKDMIDEYWELNKKLLTLHDEMDTLNADASLHGCNLKDASRYSQLDMECSSTYFKMQQLRCILSWFNNGLLFFRPIQYYQADLWVELR